MEDGGEEHAARYDLRAGDGIGDWKPLIAWLPISAAAPKKYEEKYEKRN